MSMEYRIEEMAAFRVVGLAISTTNENGEGMQKLPEFWGNVIQNNKQMDIVGLMNKPPFGLLGVNVYNTDPKNPQKFDYYIACSSDQPLPEGMKEYTVPEATWAVFPCKRDKIGETEVRVVMEWQKTAEYELLNTGYETGDMVSSAPDIEVYGQGDDVEVWVAVRKK